MKRIIINNISTSYFITEDGKCYNEKTHKFLKGQINPKNQYLTYYITLSNGSKKRIYADRAVAMCYLPRPLDKRKTQINHKDGNKLNNYADNLEWASPRENAQHILNLESKKQKHIFCFTIDKNLVAEYKTIKEAAKASRVSEFLINRELNKTEKSLCGGFYWSYNKTIDKIKNYSNLGKAKQVNQYDLTGRYLNTYSSIGTAARCIGIKNGNHIGECCRGKIKTYKGFIWRYVEDIVSPSVKAEESSCEEQKE